MRHFDTDHPDMEHHPTDVEFLTDDGDVIGFDDDVIELGRARPPRWAIVLGCAAVAAGFVTLAALKSPPTEQAVEQPAPQVTVAARAPFRYPGAALPLAGRSDALQIVIAAHRLYVLRPTQVLLVEVPRARLLAQSTLAGPNTIPAGAQAEMRLDRDAARLWVVVTGGPVASVVELDAATLQQKRRLVVPTVVFEAAALDGHLYLATPNGLADLAPGATHARILPALPEAIASVTADPTRHRMLVLTSPAPASIVAVRDGRIRESQPIGSLVNGNLVVARTQVWLSGVGRYGALLTRLDPATLVPVQADPVQHVGVAVLTAGDRVLWVSAARDGLWCVDPVTGSTLARWPSATAPVASNVGGGYVIDRGSVRSLALPDACAG